MQNRLIKMKKVGLVGGLSWVSTLDYYRFINEGVNERLGGLNFAECILYSINFDDFQRNNRQGNWDATYALLLEACEALQKSGAEAIVLCANTAHAVADRLQANIELPIIHIASETAAEIRKSGLTKVGLLGTKFTMEMNFFVDKMQEAGIELFIPDSQEVRDYIQETLRDELGRGIINPQTKKAYISIINDLIARGAQGIILGCTEIPLLLSQDDLTVPAFDTTKIHAEAAVKFALS